MPPETTSDPRLDALAALPERDVDPWRREQIRRRAQAELRRQAALARRPWLLRLERTYTRVLEPVFVASVACVYLSWAFWTASTILTGHP